jgi:hypothetical protein
MQRLVDADPVGTSEAAVVSGLPLDEEIERDVHPVHESSRDPHPFAGVAPAERRCPGFDSERIHT